MIRMEDVSYSYGKKEVLHHFNLHVKEGEFLTVIGCSGCGKTTMLKLINALLLPSLGTVYVQGRDITKTDHIALRRSIGYAIQNKGLFPHMTVEDNIAYVLTISGQKNKKQNQKRVLELLNLVGLEESLLKRCPSELSGGQRTKILLGKLLLEKPDILLLDEPTNYLDVQHIEWLKRYLNEYENAFILISHDIPFLNSVVNIIYHMENQKLDRYVGDYHHFEEVYAVKKAQLEAAYKRQQQEISELKDFVARNKARVSTRNMAMSRQKKLDKMEKIELMQERPKPQFLFKEARTAGKQLFCTKDLVIGYDEPLSSPLNLEMERGEKVVLTGANGIGKTTLLKSILGMIKPLDGFAQLGDYLYIGYFEQESSQDNTKTCIEEIWEEFPSYTQYEVRSALAKCGLTTKHIESQVRVLSGGEQAKVRLCKLINRETNLLVLDEPTNHLDADAKAELKRALKDYKGSILMVCHEPEFYEGLATSVWDCSAWSTKRG